MKKEFMTPKAVTIQMDTDIICTSSRGITNFDEAEQIYIIDDPDYSIYGNSGR